MHLIAFFRQLRIWLHYRRAAFVNTRDELEAAMRRMPPRIVVDGDEALRAFAASLLNGEAALAGQPEAESTAPLVVSPVGRIRDGYRKRRTGRPRQRPPFKGGLDIALVAATGIAAALIAEWLSYPGAPRLIERPHASAIEKPAAHALLASAHWSGWALRLATLAFAAIAVAAFGWVLWQALGLGLPTRTGWRLEYRVQGRLVMARVRRRSPA